MPPPAEAETEAKAEESKQQYQQQRRSLQQKRSRRPKSGNSNGNTSSNDKQEEYEAEQARRDETRQPRAATFKRILVNAPATLRHAQLRTLVSLDLYTFTDDLAEDIAGDNENEQRSAKEVLLSTIDATADDKLTRFALRLAHAGHVGIPREGELDFLIEAENVFAPPPPKKKAPS